MEDVNKFLTFFDKQIGDRKFLVGDSLSIADLSVASNLSVVFEIMFGEGQRKKYQHSVNWYTSIVGLNKEVGNTELPKEAHEAFRGGKKGGDKPAAEKGEKGAKGKKEETKKD